MDIEAIKADVEKITKKKPSSGGAQRDVWFFGDLVVKKDHYDDESFCKSEYENFLKFRERKGAQKFRFGKSWGNICVPDMAMLDKYVIARRVTEGVHLPFYAHECDQPECKARVNECKKKEQSDHDNMWCNECYDFKYGHHVKGCYYGKIIRGVEKWCERHMEIWDMHNENFLWDEATKTAWLVDIAA